ncbi:MAG: histidine kinase [Candidatus Aegiribacteria sp.]|nr:histidine kinase [Candidatus Aegiribacteria sp.]
MRDRKLDEIVGRRGAETVPFYTLMSKRIRNILLVSSLYDSYTLEEDGKFTEVLFSEYLNLNLRYAPRIVRVSTGEEALQRLDQESFDLVISMLSIGSMQCDELGKAITEKIPGIPFVVLAYTGRDLKILMDEGRLKHVGQAFVWQGDVRLFLAIIKSIEDMMNAEHDSRVAGVKCIILVEDSIRFCSSYLPMLYTELMQQTQALMTDGVNQMQKLMRMRARPKILHARNYEDAIQLYRSFQNHVLGMIIDVRFEKDGIEQPLAGFQLAEEILSNDPECPILFHSAEDVNRERAHSIGTAFINKNSPTLLSEVREFMRDYLGFGDFVFRNPDGIEEARAADLREMTQALRKVSDESLFYHAEKNDFSTWLMARTEFDLARALRPQKVGDFETVMDLRSYLLSSLRLWMEQYRAGQVEDFSSETFGYDTEFVKIGSGSLGGKGRGLAFVNALLNIYRIDEDFPDVNIHVPPTAVVATGVFDRFMEAPGLKELVFLKDDDADSFPSRERDRIVAEAFLEAHMPADVKIMLRTFLEEVHYPIAVRSSSLLEDSPAHPFAGIYNTYMLPNNHPDMDVRISQLLDAIKLVYASTYYSESVAYIETTPNRLEEEKMAVVIQQIVASGHGTAFYPNLAGVAKSYNFYPLDGMNEESGVASVALGLGGTVVDGGKCVRFSPDSPGRLYQFSSTDEFLRNSQREFLALDLEKDTSLNTDDPGKDMHLVTLDLSRAQEDGTLAPVGSVYSADNDMIIDGTFRPGAKLVTMAGVLKGEFFPLAKLLKHLLRIGKIAFSSDIEIEFAVNLENISKGKPHEFGFLQIRPMGHNEGTLPEMDHIDETSAICISHQVLGYGFIKNIRDIIYVSAKSFDRSKTAEIAVEIEQLNHRLSHEKRPSLLIGPGRWGSADSWLGIPVKWNQISSVRCMVEIPLMDMDVTPSQGTHFFQNITSLGIGYFTLKKSGNDYLDTDYLENFIAETETVFLRHIRFEKPLGILINTHVKKGIIHLT